MIEDVGARETGLKLGNMGHTNHSWTSGRALRYESKALGHDVAERAVRLRLKGLLSNSNRAWPNLNSVEA